MLLVSVLGRFASSSNAPCAHSQPVISNNIYKHAPMVSSDTLMAYSNKQRDFRRSHLSYLHDRQMGITFPPRLYRQYPS